MISLITLTLLASTSGAAPRTTLFQTSLINWKHDLLQHSGDHSRSFSQALFECRELLNERKKALKKSGIKVISAECTEDVYGTGKPHRDLHGGLLRGKFVLTGDTKKACTILGIPKC